MFTITITNNEIQAIEADELVGKIEFEREGSELVILHTYAYQSGRGIGSLLMDAAVAYAAEQNLIIRPVCSFAVKYMERRK